MTERKIIHIDMDAFFASVEQRDNPDLRGKPMAVGGTGERGVIATASYEARKFGVHSAMSSRRAKTLCPQLILVPGRYDVYHEVSGRMHEIFHEYTDIIEPISMDEAFLDVTENKKGMTLAMDIAREIKAKIRERLQLTASAGVSYCKFLAKIASDYRKPDGLTVIHPFRAQEFIDGLEIEEFWGVGKATAEKMHALGIATGAQLREVPLPVLTREFGKMGRMFYNFARGIDERPVVSLRIRKSVGCETTFLHDISDAEELDRMLEDAIEELHRRVESEDFHGYTLTLKLRFHDFRSITRSQTQDEEMFTPEAIRPVAQQLLESVDYSENPIRLLGLSVSNSREEDPNLYDDDPQLRIRFPDLEGTPRLTNKTPYYND